MADRDLQAINSSGELTGIKIGGDVEAEYVSLSPQPILPAKPLGTLGFYDDPIVSLAFSTGTGWVQLAEKTAATGTFTSQDGKTITVQNGVITSIV